MIERERFTIEIEGVTGEKAIWDNNKLICFIKDKGVIPKLIDTLNQLNEENNNKECDEALNKIWEILKAIKGVTDD